MTLGGYPVVLEANGTLLVYFHRIDDHTVSMDLVVDMNNLPDWYEASTGTWFEKLDLS